MTATARIDSAPRAKLSIATRPTIVPSAPRLFPLRQLMRAKENVRHTRVDEDVRGLADDIKAHGLLQSLIGYADARPDSATVHIVGGGRRLQALDSLMMDNIIDGDFTVPVLIRDAEQAVELSLAENLQQRTMSPVDEFLAFKALIDTGHHNPAGLAKRFGFSERVVKQRLRLAELAPDILDALAARELSIDAAMAYAGTQDRTMQTEIFRAESRRSWDAHAARNIRQAIAAMGMKTSDPLFRFVGAGTYEARGGRYEDDLFSDDTSADGVRALTNPFLLQTIATEHVEFEMLSMLPQLQGYTDLSPTIRGYVIVPGMKLASWGYSGPIAAPPGFVQAERYDAVSMWRTIRNNAIDVHVLVGIDEQGDLIAWPKIVFVPGAQKQAVAPDPALGNAGASPEQIAEMLRVQGVLRWSRRLAAYELGGVPLFAGTGLEGRAFWPPSDRDDLLPATIDGVSGVMMPVDIFLTDDEVAAQRKAAEKRFAQEAKGDDA